ncbi:dihydrolipoamide acetyltransferase family protein [Candidatus Binatus sp.]|uniref:dihydrolipoamide acetyltransferase family protein n=1 Tax=Candidatus Binatus sp. TaxID=2811406 RepID=UPI003CB2CEBD
MPIEIRLEKMSDTMESATLVRWIKQAGEKVAAGEVIAEVETDKATVELEAPAGGIMHRILIPEGTENIPVGELLAVIESGTSEEASVEPRPAVPKAERPPMRADVSRSASVPQQLSEKPAETMSVDLSATSTETATIDPASVKQAPTRLIGATPLARAMARITGIDLASVDSSAGDVTRAQIELALGMQKRPWDVAKTSAGVQSEETGGGHLVRHNVIRKVIAARMTESKQKIPHFYLTIECDVSSVTQLLERLNHEKLPIRLTLTSLTIKAVASAIRRVPAVNSDWKPNHLVMRETNIAVGVAAPGGLVAPVIKRPDQKTLLEIASELEELINRARNGQLTPRDTAGGTFTISNLGMFGVDTVFPIITPGQSGVLGIGASRDCPVIRDGAVVASKMMTATFSGDHRAIDGAQGAEFLRDFKQFMEDPARMIL